MRERISQLIFFCLTILAASCVYADAPGMTFLIQNKWGDIYGISVDPQSKPSSPAMVRTNVDPLQYREIIDLDAFSDGGYQLSAMGKVLPIGKARLPYAAWVPIRDATALAMSPREGGGWIASGNMVKKLGSPPLLIVPSLERDEVISDIEYNPAGQRMAVLTEKGTIVSSNIHESKKLGSIELQNERAIDIEFASDGYLVLTDQGKVYHWTADGISLSADTGELKGGFACDLETSLIGDGYYVLDIFGKIHAFGGAPHVPTEPVTPPAAADLEIIPGNTLPQWNPPGLETRAGWGSTHILLDPQGPSKPVSLHIEKAEHLTMFLAEIKFDPSLLTISPYSVTMGAWWGKGLSLPQIAPVVDAENGILKLTGSGDYLPYEGATGEGELAKFSITPVSGVTEAVTTLEITEFNIRDSYQADHTASIINSCTVSIRPIQPELDFAWKQDGRWISPDRLTCKPGEIIEAGILVKNGSRISQFEFGFRFTTKTLRFLGADAGDVWQPGVDVETLFDIPSMGNQNGALRNQKVASSQPGACRDQRNAIVSLFFSIISPGTGGLHLTNTAGKDIKGNSVDIQKTNLKLNMKSD